MDVLDLDLDWSQMVRSPSLVLSLSCSRESLLTYQEELAGDQALSNSQ